MIYLIDFRRANLHENFPLNNWNRTKSQQCEVGKKNKQKMHH